MRRARGRDGNKKRRTGDGQEPKINKQHITHTRNTNKIKRERTGENEGRRAGFMRYFGGLGCDGYVTDTLKKRKDGPSSRIMS